jgi:hypothetical protein
MPAASHQMKSSTPSPPIGFPAVPGQRQIGIIPPFYVSILIASNSQ